jgi:hypothetical protein
MRICVLVFAAAMLTAAPAFAQTDPATTTPTVEAVAQEPAATAPTTEAPAETTQAATQEPERVCRTFQRTESRLRTRRERVCHTQAEWDQMARDAASMTENMRGPPPEN